MARKGQVEDELGLYVYMLVDPRTHTPFYIGKGRGLRWAAHEDAVPETVDIDEDKPEMDRKIRRISEIKAAGLRPETWILRYGMSKQEYTAVEAAVIDLLNTFTIEPSEGTANPILPLGLLQKGDKRPLVNARREASRGHGIRSMSEIYDELTAEPLTNQTRMLMIKLGGWVDDPSPLPDGGSRAGYGFKHEWLVSEIRERHLDELGDAARGAWNIAEWRFTESNPERYEYLVAVHGGVTRGLFHIIPNSFTYSDDPSRKSVAVEPVRSGPLWEDVVGRHGHTVPGMRRGTQNPVYYWPR